MKYINSIVLSVVAASLLATTKTTTSADAASFEYNEDLARNSVLVTDRELQNLAVTTTAFTPTAFTTTSTDGALAGAQQAFPSWWSMYRMNFTKQELKNCRYLLQPEWETTPVTGSTCRVSPRDMAFGIDYYCMFGTKTCDSLQRPFSPTHPTRRCQCDLSTERFTCDDDWPPCETEIVGTVNSCPPRLPNFGIDRDMESDKCSTILDCNYMYGSTMITCCDGRILPNVRCQCGANTFFHCELFTDPCRRAGITCPNNGGTNPVPPPPPPPPPTLAPIPAVTPPATPRPTSAPVEPVGNPPTPPPSRAPIVTSPPSRAPIVTSPPSRAPVVTSPPSRAPIMTSPPTRSPVSDTCPAERPPITGTFDACAVAGQVCRYGELSCCGQIIDEFVCTCQIDPDDNELEYNCATQSFTGGCPCADGDDPICPSTPPEVCDPDYYGDLVCPDNESARLNCQTECGGPIGFIGNWVDSSTCNPTSRVWTPSTGNTCPPDPCGANGQPEDSVCGASQNLECAAGLTCVDNVNGGTCDTRTGTCTGNCTSLQPDGCPSDPPQFTGGGCTLEADAVCEWGFTCCCGFCSVMDQCTCQADQTFDCTSNEFQNCDPTCTADPDNSCPIASQIDLCDADFFDGIQCASGPDAEILMCQQTCGGPLVETLFAETCTCVEQPGDIPGMWTCTPNTCPPITCPGGQPAGAPCGGSQVLTCANTLTCIPNDGTCNPATDINCIGTCRSTSPTLSPSMALDASGCPMTSQGSGIGCSTTGQVCDDYGLISCCGTSVPETVCTCEASGTFSCITNSFNNCPSATCAGSCPAEAPEICDPAFFAGRSCPIPGSTSGAQLQCLESCDGPLVDSGFLAGSCTCTDAGEYVCANSFCTPITCSQGVGDICGGTQNIACASGLQCSTSNGDFGLCTDPNATPSPTFADLRMTPFDYNCEPLNSDLQIRWQVVGSQFIDYQLVGKYSGTNYAAFGKSGSDTATLMDNGDFTVVDFSTAGVVRARDFHVNGPRQVCSGGVGVCPDVDGGLTSDTSNIFARQLSVGGDLFTVVGYRRPLVGSDPNTSLETTTPISVLPGLTTRMIWSMGTLNGAGLPTYHGASNRGGIDIDFGRTVADNCTPLS